MAFHCNKRVMASCFRMDASYCVALHGGTFTHLRSPSTTGGPHSGMVGPVPEAHTLNLEVALLFRLVCSQLTRGCTYSFVQCTLYEVTGVESEISSVSCVSPKGCPPPTRLLTDQHNPTRTKAYSLLQVSGARWLSGYRSWSELASSSLTSAIHPPHACCWSCAHLPPGGHPSLSQGDAASPTYPLRDGSHHSKPRHGSRCRVQAFCAGLDVGLAEVESPLKRNVTPSHTLKRSAEAKRRTGERASPMDFRRAELF